MAGRYLTERQAQNCENAVGNVCKCRCGGALHGSRRGGTNNNDGTIIRSFFESLPEDDPHRLPTGSDKDAVKAAQREARNAKARAATEARNQKLIAAYQRLYDTNQPTLFDTTVEE